MVEREMPNARIASSIVDRFVAIVLTVSQQALLGSRGSESALVSFNSILSRDQRER